MVWWEGTVWDTARGTYCRVGRNLQDANVVETVCAVENIVYCCLHHSVERRNFWFTLLKMIDKKLNALKMPKFQLDVIVANGVAIDVLTTYFRIKVALGHWTLVLSLPVYSWNIAVCDVQQTNQKPISIH